MARHEPPGSLSDILLMAFNTKAHIAPGVFAKDVKTLLAAARLKMKSMPEEAMTAAWFATDMVKRQGEQKYIRIARKLFNDQEKETVARLPAAFPGLKSAGKGQCDVQDLVHNYYMQGNPYMDDPDNYFTKKQDMEQALAIFDLEKWYEETLKRFGPSVAASIVEGYTNGLDQIGIDDLVFPEEDPRAVAMAKKVLNKVKGINDTVVVDLANLFPQAIDEGADIDELTDLVQRVFGFAKNRSRTIAQTTATPVFEEGQLMSYEDAGLSKRKWVSRRDGKVRNGKKWNHVKPDGQVRKITTKFMVSGERLKFPGDPDGSAGNVINCRCTTFPAI